jgi:hypothetical protein
MDMSVELPDVRPFFMDRMVNHMYYQKYSMSSTTALPHLQAGCQLPPNTFTEFSNASPLYLEVRMCIHGADLRSTFLQDYALENITELLAKDVTIADFAKAAKLAFVSHTGPPLLQQILATYAAHKDKDWGYLPNEAATYENLLRILEFAVQTYRAGRRIALMKQDGSLPAPDISKPWPTSYARQESSSEFECALMEFSHTPNLYEDLPPFSPAYVESPNEIEIDEF